MSSSPSCWVSTLVPTSRRSPTSVAWWIRGASFASSVWTKTAWVSCGFIHNMSFSADTVVFLTCRHQRTTMPTDCQLLNSLITCVTTPDKRRFFLIPPITLSVILWLMQVKSVPSTFSLLYDAFSWTPGPSHLVSLPDSFIVHPRMSAFLWQTPESWKEAQSIIVYHFVGKHSAIRCRAVIRILLIRSKDQFTEPLVLLLF